MSTPPDKLIAIACGGTGGHLFPGLAVAQELESAGVAAQLFVSEKEVDQVSLRSTPLDRVVRLPVVAPSAVQGVSFIRGFARSLVRCAREFGQARPDAVLGMGGFASAAVLVAARARGIPIYLHEANSIPGRANRWLAWTARDVFVFFPSAARQLGHKRPRLVGMPVRDQIRPLDASVCRDRLGLATDRPTLLIMGGSQGAVGLNEAFLRALPSLRLMEPRVQYVHLTGSLSYEKVAAAYNHPDLVACVRPFMPDIEVAMGASDLAISRAGASSLAELAATGLPPILIPFPAAAGNHQEHNARHFAEAGAARVIPQAEARPERLLWEIRGLLRRHDARASMADALDRRRHPEAAKALARHLLEAIGAESPPEEREPYSAGRIEPEPYTR